jgi:hypothetical protein
MSHAHAIAFARRVLLGSARTVSGGDAYDGLRILFQSDQLVITPDKLTASPVVLQIIPSLRKPNSKHRGSHSKASSLPDLDVILAASSDEHTSSTFGMDSILRWPKIKALVTSSYKICNQDPEDEDDIVWAKIEACFCKTFRW